MASTSRGQRRSPAPVSGGASGRNCATVVLANMWDLVDRDDPSAAEELRAAAAHGLRFMPDAPLIAVSA